MQSPQTIKKPSHSSIRRCTSCSTATRLKFSTRTNSCSEASPAATTPTPLMDPHPRHFKRCKSGFKALAWPANASVPVHTLTMSGLMQQGQARYCVNSIWFCAGHLQSQAGRLHRLASASLLFQPEEVRVLRTGMIPSHHLAVMPYPRDLVASEGSSMPAGDQR